MFLFLVISTVFNICIVGINSSGTYNYDMSDTAKGPLAWPSECKTLQQSPINIIESDVQQFPYPTVLNIEMFSVMPETIIAKREEFNLEFKIKYPNNKQSLLYGGPLGAATYLFEKIHFHWGDSCAGSEHAINSKLYAAEAHLIHFNSKYGTFEIASTKADGLTVIAVLIELVIDDEKNAIPSAIAKLLQKVKDAKTDPYTVEISDFIKISDIVRNKYFSYYAYKGGLTSPPCQTGVTWIVSKDTLKLPSKDILEFKSIRNSDKKIIERNNRPIQKLNDRTVYLFLNN